MTEWVNINGMMVPRIKASDIQGTPGSWYSQGDGDMQFQQGTVGLNGDYGEWSQAHPFSSEYMLQGFGNNVGQSDWTLDPNLQSFNILKKTGDKEGSQINYVRNGDYYEPTWGGTHAWDTNRNTNAWAPLAIAGGAALGAALTGPGVAAPASGSVGGSWAGMGLSDPAVMGGAGGWIGGNGGWAGLGLTDPSVMGGPGGWVGGSTPSLLEQVGQWAGKPSNLSPIAKGIGLLGGALAGSNSAGGSQGSAIPVTPPQMYGGNAAPPSFQTVGNTETERQMMQQYLPGLFGGGAPRTGLLDGRMVPPIRRSLLMGG